MARYVGVDLHRRRSVVVVLGSDGTELRTKRTTLAELAPACTPRLVLDR